MASSYLGPESPRPMSVVCEAYQKQFQYPVYTDQDRFRFGEEYERKMLKLLHKYLELGTTDRFCYVGDTKGSMIDSIQQQFCLLEPVMTVHPGHFHYAETENQKMLPIRIAHVGAEEYFRDIAKKVRKGEMKTPFDKILLKDAIRYFEEPKETFKNLMEATDEYGKIIIIHRAESLITLPFSQEAKQRLEEYESPYMDVINQLQSINFDVQWQLEMLPILMPKRKWLSMLKNKYPTQAELLSDFELVVNERNLVDGALKYEGEMIEFVDRLFFITATRSQLENGFPVVQRYGTNNYVPYPTAKDLKLTMDVTPDIKKFVHKKERKKRFSEEFP